MVTRRECDVLVIGAGVSGLTTAVCLAEAGLGVRVVSEHGTLQTSSAVAGASWGLYLVDDDPRALNWSRETRTEMEKLASHKETGVRLVNGMEASRQAVAPPAWAIDVRDFQVCPPDRLPPGFSAGWRYTIPVVHMPSYLTYLADRLRQAGVTVERAAIRSLGQRLAPTVVNCAGIGARTLAADNALVGVRGQLVVVENPGIDWFFHGGGDDYADLTYFIPHEDHIVLGGTAVPDASGLAPHPDLTPDPRTTADIIARCAAIEPRLGAARLIEQRVGVRPVRPTVRLEYASPAATNVIHNYGHGGSGVSLSWGCAREVLAMILS
jgi:D-amino-acid oxidase